MAEPVDRFKLNNLSFAGPVIMGVGGKIRSVIINQGLPSFLSMEKLSGV